MTRKLIKHIFTYFVHSPLHRACSILIIAGICSASFSILYWLADSPIRTEHIPLTPSYVKNPLQPSDLIGNNRDIHYDTNCVIQESRVILIRYNEFESERDIEIKNDPTLPEEYKSQNILEEISNYPFISGNLIDTDVEIKHGNIENKVSWLNKNIIAHLREKCGYKLIKQSQQYRTEKIFAELTRSKSFKTGLLLIIIGLLTPLVYSVTKRIYKWIISGN